jgi:hypothetical protein
MSALTPRESGEYIVKNAEFLTVSDDGIENLTEKVSFIGQSLLVIFTTQYAGSISGNWRP